MRPNAETLKLYKNLGNGTFRDVTAEVGLSRQQGLQFAEAACFGKKRIGQVCPIPFLRGYVRTPISARTEPGALAKQRRLEWLM